MPASRTTGPTEAIGAKVRSGAKPEAADLKHDLLLSAASGRSRDRDGTARNQDFCALRVSMFFLI
jgi:hypothetical protein